MQRRSPISMRRLANGRAFGWTKESLLESLPGIVPCILSSLPSWFIFDSSQSKCCLRIQSSSSLSHLPKGRVFLLQTRVSLTGVRGGVGFGLKVNNNGRAPLVPSATTDYCTPHAIVVPPNLTPNKSHLPQTTTEPHC